VHLDFHTSEKIPNIGEKFSKQQFQKALQLGFVDSITLFSKCHHGWAYHPSKANEIHPNLKFDLLGAQIAAAHEIGIKAPVYLSAGLDEKMARRHPEWLSRNKDESLVGTKNFCEPGYHVFCLNSPYLDYLLAQIKEVCENYDADGIFLDIVCVHSCYCQNCINSLIKEDKDPYDEVNILEFAEKTYANYTKRVRKSIDSVKPGLPVFHNGGHITRGRRDLAYMNTHLELESLPTGGWGYDHFPLSAAYARTLGIDFLGMTGKFHTTWGEFGGFKHPNAIRYEVALSAAYGARCSIGDQLHPSGEMDIATYKLIGAGYSELVEKEEWLLNSENIADIGVLSLEAVNNYYKNSLVEQKNKAGNTDAGCVRILLECNYLFNVIDISEDFNNYKVIILPDNIFVDKMLKGKLDVFTTNGGKLLATGKSGLYKDKEEFAINIGIKYLGENEFNPDYFKPNFNLPEFDNTSFVMYSKGQKIENISAKELGFRENPFFNRSTFDFCSHQHTPSSNKSAGVAMVRNNKTIYISWEVFEDYATSGSIILKEMVKYSLDELLENNKTLKTNLPAQGVVSLTKQKSKYINHLLYAVPVKRGSNIEVIEDIVPLYDVVVEVKVDKKIENVYLVPEMEYIDYVQEDNYVKYIVPKVENHQMVVLE